MQQSFGIQTSNKSNPKLSKLIAQNTKINKQICELQQKMSDIITGNVVKKLEKEMKKSMGQTKIQEIVVQEAYIKRLKNKLNQLKSLNVTQMSKGIRRQENQLIQLKRQYQKLYGERQTRTKIFNHKQQTLQQNKPLNNCKQENLSQLAKVRKRNSQMIVKITELSRQVRKYHNYQQMHKHLKDQPVVIDNCEYEQRKIEHQKNGWMKRTKDIQLKWKPVIEALDAEYFRSKEIFDRKNKEIQEKQKEIKNWQNRISATRNQNDVLMDRERISKVLTKSPLKEVKEKVRDKNQKNGEFIRKSVRFESEKKRGGMSNLIREFKGSLNNIDDISEMGELPKYNEQKYGSRSQIFELTNSEAKKNKTRFSLNKTKFVSQQGQKIQNEEQVKIDKGEGKKKYIGKNIGVGTSFYANNQ